MNVTCRSLLIVSAMMATFAVPAHSQVRSGSSKILGTAMRGHEAEADIYRQHAADRSRIIYYYSQTQVPLRSSEVKGHINSIRADLDSSSKQLEKIKQQHPQDKSILKQIAVIEARYAKARQVCGMVESECAKHHGDEVIIGDCCSEMWHELDAAGAEMKKLHSMLKTEALPIPPKLKTSK